MLIEKMITEARFDIFTNAQIKESDIKYLAKKLEEEQRINLTEFLDMTKCSTKSCWKNFLSVIKHFSYRNRFRCMDVLFTFLQDANWPVYDDTVDFLCSFDEADILPYIGLYLEKAHERKDEIWEENIYHLISRLGVEALNLP